ncbi:MAG TPA: 4-hydroxy-tetrahydrodipicolinate synthase [Longimicrobiales bacterium]|nr:4-hydroxy-tetrahydrodipicolinate synthase [Longimicrobiales bacterium]
MPNPRFEGSGVALVTPFDNVGVNERVLRELVAFHIAEGTDALIICGSTGEAATMSPDEQRTAVEIAVDASKGRLPIVAGCGGSDTKQVGRLAGQAREAGADAILISAPPYNKPTQAGIVAHVRHVMDQADLPAILYNVPSRAGVNMLPATIEEMAQDKRVIGVKEACGDISQIAQLAHRVGDTLDIWSGNDDQTVAVMALGGKGIISVMGNVIPRKTSEMAKAFLKGDTAGARALQLEFLPLYAALFAEANPIPVKAALTWLGFNVGEPRLPLMPITPAVREKLLAALSDAGLKPRR